MFQNDANACVCVCVCLHELDMNSFRKSASSFLEPCCFMLLSFYSLNGASVWASNLLKPSTFARKTSALVVVSQGLSFWHQSRLLESSLLQA